MQTFLLGLMLLFLALIIYRIVSLKEDYLGSSRVGENLIVRMDAENLRFLVAANSSFSITGGGDMELPASVTRIGTQLYLVDFTRRPMPDYKNFQWHRPAGSYHIVPRQMRPVLDTMTGSKHLYVQEIPNQ